MARMCGQYLGQNSLLGPLLLLEFCPPLWQGFVVCTAYQIIPHNTWIVVYLTGKQTPVGLLRAPSSLEYGRVGVERGGG